MCGSVLCVCVYVCARVCMYVCSTNHADLVESVGCIQCLPRERPSSIRSATVELQHKFSVQHGYTHHATHPKVSKLCHRRELRWNRSTEQIAAGLVSDTACDCDQTQQNAHYVPEKVVSVGLSKAVGHGTPLNCNKVSVVAIRLSRWVLTHSVCNQS